jgi:hypothetical protein
MQNVTQFAPVLLFAVDYLDFAKPSLEVPDVIEMYDHILRTGVVRSKDNSCPDHEDVWGE